MAGNMRDNHPALPHRVQQVGHLTVASVTERELAAAAAHHQASKARNTLASYESDARLFEAWCEVMGTSPHQVTPADICIWLTHQVTADCPNLWIWDSWPERRGHLERGPGLSIRTVTRRLVAIRRYLDRRAGDNPARSDLVREHLYGVSRLHGKRPDRAPGLGAKRYREVMASFGQSDRYADHRDQLLLALGFGAALRVSDLANLLVENVVVQPGGLVLGFERRKHIVGWSTVSVVMGTDPVACPVRLFQRFIELWGASTGPLLRRASKWNKPTAAALDPRSIARIISRRAAAVFDDVEFRGHSLRRGFIDSALMAGASIPEVMKISKHKDPKTLMIYLDEIGEFANHPGKGLY